MNSRLFSVVLAAVGSLALAACTINTTDGNTGGAGGTGGTGATGPGPGSTGTGGTGGTSGVGGGGGMGGAAPCQTCAEVITPPDGDLNSICATSSDIFNALNECVCGGGGMMGMCEAECTDMTGACFAWGTLPDPCIMCRTNMCSSTLDPCANDIP